MEDSVIFRTKYFVTDVESSFIQHQELLVRLEEKKVRKRWGGKKEVLYGLILIRNQPVIPYVEVA